jgi:16S rRNA (guanine527-N7)-methyltransferase
VPGTDHQGDPPVVSESLESVLAEARELGFFGPGPLEPQVRHAQGFVVVARPLFGATSPRLVDMGAGGGLPGLVVAQQWPELSLVLLEAMERRSAFLRRAVDRLELGDRVSVRQERAEMCGRDPAWRASFDGAIARSFGRPAVLAECTAPLLKPGAWIVVSEPPTSSQASPDGSGSETQAGSDAVAVEPQGTEPQRTEPQRTEPPGTEPQGTEPQRTEPPGTEPQRTAQTERHRTEPASAESAPPQSEVGGSSRSASGPTERWPAEALRQFGLERGQLVHAEFDYQLLRQVEPCPERFPRRNGVPGKKPLF